MKDILLSGGFFVYAILAISVLATVLIARRFFQLWIQFRLDAHPLLSKVAQLVNAGDYGQAVQLVQGKHPLHRLMQAALLRANRSESDIRRGVEAAAVTELARVRAGTATLPALANLAALLGLLGTLYELVIQRAPLANGVAVAFYHAFLGLCVSVVIVGCHALIAAKEDRELVRIDHATRTLVDQLITVGKKK